MNPFILHRLGLVLTGSNSDLEAMQKPSRDESSKNSPSSGDESEEGDEDSDESEGEDEGSPEGGDSDDDSGSEEEDSEESSEGGDDGGEESEDDLDDSGEEGEEGEEGESEGSQEGDASDEPEGKEDSGKNKPGGPLGDDQAPIDLAQALLNAFETGLLDNSTALEDAVKSETHGDVLPDERIWRPMNPDLDNVTTVRPADAAVAQALLASVRVESAFLATRMRSKFLAARAPQVAHGVRKGVGLSERRLVESVIELNAGRRPTRPDWERRIREECSLATAVVLDESGSMAGLRAAVSRAALAIASPMNTLGSPCLVVGPRGGGSAAHRYTEIGAAWKDFHRTEGVTIDIFKDWNEDLRSCLRRFPNVKADGGTPLEDGVQYAMQEMSNRPERHRVIFVLTDGQPDNQAVCRRQIRQAAEVGIHIIGVALDKNCAYSVKSLFSENITVSNISELPSELLKALDSIVFPKVGKKIKFDLTLAAKKDKK